MFCDPLFGGGQRVAAQAKEVGTILSLPERRLLLQQTKMSRKPFCIIGANWPNESIVRKLQPGHAAPLFPAHQMSALHSLNPTPWSGRLGFPVLS